MALHFSLIINPDTQYIEANEMYINYSYILYSQYNIVFVSNLYQ